MKLRDYSSPMNGVRIMGIPKRSNPLPFGSTSRDSNSSCRELLRAATRGMRVASARSCAAGPCNASPNASSGCSKPMISSLCRNVLFQTKPVLVRGLPPLHRVNPQTTTRTPPRVGGIFGFSLYPFALNLRKPPAGKRVGKAKGERKQIPVHAVIICRLSLSSRP